MKKSGKPLSGSDRVTVSMTAKQLGLIKHTLEVHFRLSMGQALGCGLADEMAFQNVDLKNCGEEERKRLFDACIDRRDRGVEALQRFMDICLEGGIDRCRKTPEMENEIDLWSCIRHFFWKQLPEEEKRFWTADSVPPMLWGEEPEIVIRREDEDDDENERRGS